MEKINFTETKPVARLSEPGYQCVNEDGHWVIVLARGECRSGGYDIQLRDLTMENGVVTAVISERNPDPCGFMTMALTYPTRKYVLELEHTPVQVVFRKEEGNIVEVIDL